MMLVAQAERLKTQFFRPTIFILSMQKLFSGEASSLELKEKGIHTSSSMAGNLFFLLLPPFLSSSSYYLFLVYFMSCLVMSCLVFGVHCSILDNVPNKAAGLWVLCSVRPAMYPALMSLALRSAPHIYRSSRLYLRWCYYTPTALIRAFYIRNFKRYPVGQGYPNQKRAFRVNTRYSCCFILLAMMPTIGCQNIFFHPLIPGGAVIRAPPYNIKRLKLVFRELYRSAMPEQHNFCF